MGEYGSIRGFVLQLRMSRNDETTGQRHPTEASALLYTQRRGRATSHLVQVGTETKWTEPASTMPTAATVKVYS